MSDTPTPPDGLDLEHYYDLLNDMSDDEVNAWVRSHYWNLPANEQASVADWLRRTDRDVQAATQVAFGAGYGTEAEGLPPPELGSSADIIEYLQELGPQDGRAWLDAHAEDLNEHVIDDLDAWVAGQPEDSGWAAALPTTTAAADTAASQTDFAQQQVLDEAVDYVVGQYENTPDGGVPNFDDIATYAPPGLSGAPLDQWIAQAQEQGEAQYRENLNDQLATQNPEMSEEDRARLIEDRMGGLISDPDTPVWILRSLGRPLTEIEKDRFVDYWNDQQGTSFTDFSQVAPLMEATGQTEAMEHFVSSVIADQEPVISRSIDIPFANGSRRVNYTEQQIQGLREMGFGDDAITRIVRLAGINAGVDAIEPGPNGDTLPIWGTAALMSYYGAGPELGTYNQTGQEIERLEQQAGLDPGEYQAMSVAERRALRASLQTQMTTGVAMGSGGSEAAAHLAAIKQIDAMLGVRETIQGQGRAPGVMLAQGSYNRGLETYGGDQALAFISAIDPSLAQRIAASGGDPEKMTGADNAAALSILRRGGLAPGGNTAFEQIGGSIGDNVLKYLNYFDFGPGSGGGGGGGGGAGPQRRVLDPVSVKEQLQKQFGDFMLGDIPDDVVNSVTGMLQGQLDKADPGMSFDVSARILNWVQGRPEYSELYGKKPGGMNESEYQSQFVGGVQDILGAEADIDAVRSGLRSGDYQSAVGVAAIGGMKGQNSRLLGRWATAKQTLDKFS